jgi:hypothetical protein
MVFFFLSFTFISLSKKGAEERRAEGSGRKQM